MVLALIRAFAGPSLYDRVLAGNSFGTKTVLLIGAMGFLTGRPDFLDIAAALCTDQLRRDHRDPPVFLLP